MPTNTTNLNPITIDDEIAIAAAISDLTHENLHTTYVPSTLPEFNALLSYLHSKKLKHESQIVKYFDAVDNIESSYDVQAMKKPSTKVLLDDGVSIGITHYNISQGAAPVIFFSKMACLMYIKSEEIATKLGYVEDKTQGIWFKPNEKTTMRGNHEHFIYKNTFIYNPEIHSADISKKFGIHSQSFLLSEGKQYTFGAEFEAANLWLPLYKAKDYNVSCVRDGSMNAGSGGPEIVTGVLHGDNGFRHLQEICNLLSQKALLDKYCSTHIHIGGMDFNKENLLFLYKISCFIEDEIYEMVPNSRRHNSYCRKLEKFVFKHDLKTQSKEEYKINIDTDYNTLYDFLSVKGTKVRSRRNNHPMGAKCGYNHSTPRYSWVNFIPAMFNTRDVYFENKKQKDTSRTWEIRLHSATLNYTKTRNWLLIFMGVMWFVENCKSEINSDIKLSDIMYKAYPKMGKSLVQYIEERKLLFTLDISEVKEYETKSEKNKSIIELKNENNEKGFVCV